MINVSNAFKEAMKTSRRFKAAATLTLANGREIELGDEDIIIGGNSLTDAAGADTFPVGEAISRAITLEILNDTEQYADVDFLGATINLSLVFAVSDTSTERIELGTFTVTEPEEYGETVTVTAHDDMWRADVPYETKLSFPATLSQMFRDICMTCGIGFSTSDFVNSTFVVNVKPDGDYTARQMLGYIAALAGGNARINRAGKCEILTYDFTDGAAAHELDDFIDISADTDDIVITGVQTITTDADGNERKYMSGEAGYIITIDNPLISGKEQTAVDLIGERLIGATFRKFSGSLPAYPTAEFMDGVRITDRRGRTYRSVITDMTFTFFGETELACSAESAVRRGSTYPSLAAGAVAEARKLVAGERTARETAIKELAGRLSDASGLYITVEPQLDNSSIYYMHNKPTLEESDIVWKLTSEAFGISTDGGKSYPYGFTVTGEMITRLLYAEGIDADYINSGSIVARDAKGNIVFSVNVETGEVIISGDSVRIGSKSATQALADTLAESKSYTDGELIDYAKTVTSSIDNLQAQIDGAIESHYYSYAPTLDNIPASEWTTETERQKHEGDLFYDKSTGYAYRFFKDGNTWKWQPIQDTDIVKALQTAEKAQDTADGKRRNFLTTPTPPYDEGDQWTDGEDIKTCVTAKSADEKYSPDDWKKLNKYTDDSKLTQFIEETYNTDIASLREQADKKAETWYQSEDPANAWLTSEEKQEHTGDLWYDTDSQQTYIYDGSGWEETKSMPPEEVFDRIDGKAQIFIEQPKTPYFAGDLWFDSDTSDIMTCVITRKSGAYESSDWQKRNKYTDDSVANTALDEARKSTNLTIVLGNEYEGIPTDYAGAYTPPLSVATTVQVYYGHSDVSASCTYTQKASAGVVGGWNGATRTYTITGLTTDTGWVDITATYVTFTVTKRFNVAKVKGGVPGEKGDTGDKGDTGAPGSKGDTGSPGKDGAPGKDGRGIASTEIKYQSSTSGTTPPTSTWQASIPSVAAGSYLWTRTVITYTDKSTTTHYTVGMMGQRGLQGLQGEKGEQGIPGPKGEQGKDGADGKNFKILTSAYRQDQSTLEKWAVPGYIGKGWAVTSTSGVEVGNSVAVQCYNTTKNGYAYIYGTVTAVNSETSLDMKSAGMTDKGDTGAAGQTSYFHIKYAPVASPSASQMTETPDIYIGTYVDYTQADSTDPSKYKWARFQGIQGNDGAQGIPGTNGTNGQTSYLHIKYSDDGGKSFTANSGETPGDWIGQYVDFTKADSTSVSSYTWSKTKGDKGEQGSPGAKGDTGSPGKDGANAYTHIRYSASSDGSGMVTSPSASTPYIGVYTGTSASAPTDYKQYTWSKYKGDKGDTGAKGDKGAAGNGINSITYYYAATQTQTAPAASAVTATSIPTLSATNKYLWQKEVIDFTDTSVADKTTVILLAVYGDKGAKGDTGSKGDKGDVGTSVTITSTSVTYQASASGTVTPTGTWGASVPDVPLGQYLWTKTVVSYSNGTSTTAYSVAYKGTNGAKGDKGDTGAQGTQGINLLRHTEKLPLKNNESGIWTWPYSSAGSIFTDTGEGLKLAFSGTSTNDCFQIPLAFDGAVENNDTVTLSFQYRGNITSFGAFYFIQRTSPNVPLGGFPAPVVSETEWKTYKHTFSSSQANVRKCYSILLFYGITATTSKGKWVEIKKGSLKLEKGAVASPVWTPAPQDLKGADGTSVTITSTSIMYQEGTSGTAIPTSTWQTSVPSVALGHYLWTRTIVNYSDKTSTTSYSVAYKGTNGAKGDKGDTGSPGAAGRTYFIELSANVLKRGANNAVTPATLTANAYYRDGSGVARTAYAGRWVVATSTNGTSFTNVYMSSANEASHAQSVGGLTASVVAVRFTLYAAGGVTTALDMQTAPVVVDVASLTHEQIFNLLTNNGTLQGIYQEGGNLYINGAYIKAGTVSASQLASNAVTADKISAGAVNTDKLAANAVTAAKISAGAVSADALAANAVTAAKISAGAITAGKIAANAVSADNISAGAVTVGKIAANAVTAEKISAGAVNADKLAANAVTAGKIASGAVTADKIASGSIALGKLDSSTQELINASTKRYKYTVDLTASTYNADLYYPVTGGRIPAGGYHRFETHVQLDSGSKPSWSTHSRGFSVNLSVLVKADDYGVTQENGWIEDNTYSWCGKSPAYFHEMTHSSTPTFYLRGGGIYFVYCDYATTWTPRASTYTAQDQSVSPTSSPSNDAVLGDQWRLNTAIGQWCYNNNVTYINGGKIYTGTVTANAIAANAITSGKIAAGAVTADKISVTDLSALGAKIGGWTIGSTQLCNGTITSGGDGNFGMSTADFTRTVAGQSLSTLRLAIGSSFGVAKDGTVFCGSICAQGYITGGSWSSGNVVTQLNNTGICISRYGVSAGGGIYKAWILTVNSSGNLVAVPGIYSYGKWSTYQNAAKTLGTWTSSGSATDHGGGGYGGKYKPTLVPIAT